MHSCKAVACGGVLLLSIACSHSPTGPTGPTSPTSPSTPTGSSSGVQLVEDFGGRPLFPSDNWWNEDISNAPVEPQSSAYIDFIGRTRAMHPDFGPPPYGIPYVGVSGSQARVPVTFVAYGSESDSGFPGDPGYPVPAVAAISFLGYKLTRFCPRCGFTVHRTGFFSRVQFCPRCGCKLEDDARP